ncbi:MAG: NUDIX hydrolase [Alphaproteobacteria bacterium]
MRRDYPPHPLPAVGVVVWRQDRVLLVRRNKPPRAGDWSLPGGAQHPGETVREAAMREVREETGLDIEVGRLIDVVDFIEHDEAGQVCFHYVLIDLEGEAPVGEAVAGDDVGEVCWASPAALADFGLWSETVRVIEISARRRAGRSRTQDGERP